MNKLIEKLKISEGVLHSINDFLLDESNPVISSLIELIEKYGGVEEINKKAQQARNLDTILQKLEKKNANYIRDLDWLKKKKRYQCFH